MPARVVVIGAGVIGAAVASELTRLGAAVTVVDRGQPNGGTSGATFSWINSNDKHPRDYHDLNMAGMLAHRRFADQVGGADWYHGGGNLEWKDTADGRARLAQKVERLRANQYPVRWLDRAEACRLEPDMAADEVPGAGVAFYLEEGWVEPTRLVAVLLSMARQAGARVITGDPVTGFTIAGGTVSAVCMASGESVPVDAVVDCAGPSADAVAGMAGVELPMRNTPGVLIYLQPVPVAVRRVVHAPRVHLRPDGGGRLLLHTEEVDNAATQDGDGTWTVQPQAATKLVAEAGKLYPGIDGARVEAIRVGVRPIPADGLPVLGHSATVENFHFAVTHSGVTLCLRIAELLAPEVLGRSESPELASFRHARLMPSAEHTTASTPGAR